MNKLGTMDWLMVINCVLGFSLLIKGTNSGNLSITIPAGVIILVGGLTIGKRLKDFRK